MSDIIAEWAALARAAHPFAEAGAGLSTMKRAAEKVIGRTASIGMSLSTCTIPGIPTEVRIPTG